MFLSHIYVCLSPPLPPSLKAIKNILQRESQEQNPEQGCGAEMRSRNQERSCRQRRGAGYTRRHRGINESESTGTSEEGEECAGARGPNPTPRMAMNAAQHEIVNLLKTCFLLIGFR